MSPALSGAVHDLNTRLGSILMAVSAVAELDLDAETRSSMLRTASGETIRASAELAAIIGLTVCAVDDADPEPCDVSAALSTAAATVALHGIEVGCPDAAGGAVACVHANRVAVALPALLRIVAGAARGVDATVTASDDRVHVALSRRAPEQDPEPLPPVVRALVEQIGARAEANDGSSFSWPAVTP